MDDMVREHPFVQGDAHRALQPRRMLRPGPATSVKCVEVKPNSATQLSGPTTGKRRACLQFMVSCERGNLVISFGFD